MFLVTDGCLDLECYRSCCLGSSKFFKKRAVSKAVTFDGNINMKNDE